MFKTLLIATLLILGTQSSYAVECHGTEPSWSATLKEKNLSVRLVEAEEINYAIENKSYAAGMTKQFLQVYSDKTGALALVKTTKCNDGKSDITFPQEIIILRGEFILYGCCGKGVPSDTYP